MPIDIAPVLILLNLYGILWNGRYYNPYIDCFINVHGLFCSKTQHPSGTCAQPSLCICKHFLWQALETVRQETYLVVGRTNIIKQTGWFLHTQCLLFTGVGKLTIHDRSVSRVDFFQGLSSSVCRRWLPSVLSPQSPSAHASVLLSFS